MNEVNDLAGQHEVIAENLQTHIIREVNILVKDFKEDRKKVEPFRIKPHCFVRCIAILLIFFPPSSIYKMEIE